jgi:hypothetical protein
MMTGGGEEKSAMSAAFILLALIAATGFAIGTSFPWFAILISSMALAALCAAVLQIAGFDALSGIAIAAICLAVYQFAYVMGVGVATPERPDKTGEAGCQRRLIARACSGGADVARFGARAWSHRRASLRAYLFCNKSEIFFTRSHLSGKCHQSPQRIQCFSG